MTRTPPIGTSACAANRGPTTMPGRGAHQQAEPGLIDPRAGVKLVVPELEGREAAAERHIYGGQDLLDGLLEEKAAW